MFTWVNLQPDSGPDQQFYQFCDALEVKDGVNAPEQGWGFDYAYQAWSSWWSEVYMPNGKAILPSCSKCTVLINLLPLQYVVI